MRRNHPDCLAWSSDGPTFELILEETSPPGDLLSDLADLLLDLVEQEGGNDAA